MGGHYQCTPNMYEGNRRLRSCLPSCALPIFVESEPDLAEDGAVVPESSRKGRRAPGCRSLWERQGLSAGFDAFKVPF